MSNHYHVVCLPDRENSMALTFGRANAEYSRWIHIQRRQVGQLWQGRYRSCLLDESHLWNALCYVEQNPVRAGMTSCAWEWRWSSAAARIGLVLSDIPLDWSLWKERHDPETWRKVLELGLREAAFADRLRQATERGRPLGPVAFLENLELRLSRSVRPQRRGRKPKPAVAKEGLPNCAME